MNKLRKRLLVCVTLNIALILLLMIAIGEAQRNRKLYMDEEARNSNLIIEINDRNNTIEDLKGKLKDFGVEYTY